MIQESVAAAPSTLDLYGRLLAALICGAAIGVERRLRAQAAGLRTQMLICAGSCLVTIVSFYFPLMQLRGDPDRIAASIMGGVGFIGGGAILRKGPSVQGLTTAASIWTSAAVGLALGAGLYRLGIPLAVVAVLGLEALEPLEGAITGRRQHRTLRLETDEGSDLVERIRPILDRYGLRVDEIGVSRRDTPRKTEVRLLLSCPETADVEHLVHDRMGTAGIKAAQLE